MTILDLFSKRKKRERGEYSDVYSYDNIPQTFRVQLVHMIKEAFAEDGEYWGVNGKNALGRINKLLCKEYGVFRLAGEYDGEFESIGNFILRTQEHEKVLDVIEITFRFIDKYVRKNTYQFNRHLNVDDFISELNHRFKEASLGYQYESGEIVRVDSQYIHSEAVKPTLSILKNRVYKSVNEEFLSAHEHYRHKRYEESTTECLKALESLLKTICSEKKWAYDQKDTAKKLISICLQNGLVPTFMQNQLNLLQTLLESGVPTVRNKLSGHGQGPTPRQMPEYFASYTLHLTASTILLLANAANL
jgi:hypothetical protein